MATPSVMCGSNFHHPPFMGGMGMPHAPGAKIRLVPAFQWISFGGAFAWVGGPVCDQCIAIAIQRGVPPHFFSGPVIQDALTAGSCSPLHAPPRGQVKPE